LFFYLFAAIFFLFGVSAGEAAVGRTERRTAAYLHRSDALLLEHARHLDHLLAREAIVKEVIRVDLDEYGNTVPHLVTDSAEHLEVDARAVDQATAILVRTPVEVGRKELIQQVRVRRMNLHAIEARVHCPPGGATEVTDDVPYLGLRQLPARAPVGQRHRGGADPFAVGIVRSTAAVSDLHQRPRTVGMSGVRKP
jgi:hypothetical protein